ncbi:MAG: DNA primase, partial [Rubrobacter sp.]|nr:DNA primase [Rubrobacter sp.]
MREAANIVEVASEFTALKRQGTNYTGLCPYHQEKTPSFSVSPEKSFYYCFGCSKGGDAIKLVMELKSFSFAEAVSHLAERFGVELKFEGRSPGEERAAAQRTARRRSAYKALAAATAYYHKYLLKSPVAEEARQYLKDRGFGQSTIEEFRLGYAPPRGRPGFMQAARKVGLNRGALEAAGLLSQRGGERFVDRVTFPISDRRGRIVGFGARALGDAKPKYLNSPETELFNKRSLLYGFPQVTEAVRKAGAALVVEGYTDVLMLYQSGIKNAVATLGTAMTEQHLKTLSSYADKIYLLFDPDAAGGKAVEKAEDVAELTFTATKLNSFLYVVRLPEDPADWLLSHSVDEFNSSLHDAVSIVEYTIRSLSEEARGRDAVTRQQAMPKILDYVQKVGTKAPTLELEAKRLVADALQVSPVRLEDLLASRKVSAKHEGRKTETPASKDSPRRSTFTGDGRYGEEDPLVEAGREVLALVLARPGLAARSLQAGMEIPGSLNEPVVLGNGDFADETHTRIFALLVEHAEDPGAVLSDKRARPLMDEISALRAAGEKLYPSEASLRTAWFRLAVLSREKAKL